MFESGVIQLEKLCHTYHNVNNILLTGGITIFAYMIAHTVEQRMKARNFQRKNSDSTMTKARSAQILHATSKANTTHVSDIGCVS